MTTSDGLKNAITTVLSCGESMMTKKYGHRMWQYLHMVKCATCPATESISVQQRL
jgi:hypothetical protein